MRLLLTALAFLAAAPAFAQAPPCERSDIEDVAANYVKAQTEGFPLLLKPADFSQYVEQGAASSMSSGTISTPLKVVHHRAVIDVPTCTAFTELVGTGPKGALLIGARTQYAGTFNPIAPERVNEIELLVSTAADATAKLAAAENWSPIAENARRTRAALIAVADAYLTAPNSAALAPNCTLLAGGASETCATSLTAGADRRYVVDETTGSVAAIFTNTANKALEARLFRIENGKIRYVHAIPATPAKH